MATITISVTGLTSKVVTLSTNDTNRVIAAWKAQYGSLLTNQQAFDQWANGCLNTLSDIVKTTELQVSYAAVLAAFVPIVFT